VFSVLPKAETSLKARLGLLFIPVMELALKELGNQLSPLVALYMSA